MKVREEDLRKELETAIAGADSQSRCASRLGIRLCFFKQALHRARIHGIEAVLHSNTRRSYDGAFKLDVVRFALQEGSSSYAAAVRFNLVRSVVSSWVSRYQEGGEAMLLSDSRGGQRGMGRKPKPKLEDLEEGSLEYYKLKSEQLERENLLLKKALPLVRDAIRNRSRGRSGTGSSEN